MENKYTENENWQKNSKPAWRATAAGYRYNNICCQCKALADFMMEFWKNLQGKWVVISISFPPASMKQYGYLHCPI